MFDITQIDEIKEFLDKTPGKIYLGCDSRRFLKNDKWVARYMVVLICHINNNNGGKLFTAHKTLPIYDNQANKPRMRLMQEVFMVVEAYQQLEHILIDREVEIHLDLNADAKHVSNMVLKEAVGYVAGVTGIFPQVKPHSWAGHSVADAGVHGRFAITA